jgi:hypothetical protein
LTGYTGEKLQKKFAKKINFPLAIPSRL